MTLVSALTSVPAVSLAGDFPLSLAAVGFRAVEGSGKWFFLSMAWTVRSKRRKSDSARVRMGMSSIELESSFTDTIH